MHACGTTNYRGGAVSMVVLREHPFNQQQASYYDYLRRYKDSGAVDGRVRFDDFLRYERLLAENEFFMAGLRDQGKTRGGSMPKLIKQQRDMRAALLIEEEEKTAKKNTETPSQAGVVPPFRAKPADEETSL